MYGPDGDLFGQAYSVKLDKNGKPLRVFVDGPGKGRKVPDDAPLNIVDEYVNDNIFDEDPQNPNSPNFGNF